MRVKVVFDVSFWKTDRFVGVALGAGLCLIPFGVFGHLGSVPRFPTGCAGRDSAYRDHVVTLDPSVGGLREFCEVRDDRDFAPLDRAKYSLN